MLSLEDGSTACCDRALLYVTGKGGVGKTTVAAALGLAAAAARAPDDRLRGGRAGPVSRAFARQGVRPEQEVELAENLWAITIDPQQALEEWLSQPARRRSAGRLISALARLPVLRGRRARARRS